MLGKFLITLNIVFSLSSACFAGSPDTFECDEFVALIQHLQGTWLPIKQDFSGFGNELSLSIYTTFPNVNLSEVDFNNIDNSFCSLLQSQTDVSQETYINILKDFLHRGDTYASFLTKTDLLSTHETEEEKIVHQMISYHILKNGSILVIQLPHFFDGEKTFEFNFSVITKNVDFTKIQSILIDLRNNPGGDIHKARYFCDKFMKENKIIARVYTSKDKIQGGEGSYVFTTSDTESFQQKLYVWVNENTKSAAEIVAGALAEHSKATLIGTKTFGKLSGQTPYLDLQKKLHIDFSAWISFTTHYFTIGSHDAIATQISIDHEQTNAFMTYEEFANLYIH